ncbi:hypothetical protein [Kitasatospora cineracea]|uniref:hypothetical protein n=1 Tax=Kitasatospora cineracea TaxID=88074 RepID=UPI00378E18DF
MAYRYWCGECGYRTPWDSESRGEDLLIEHYDQRHPGIAPGGQTEVNRKDPESGDGCGCLGLLATAFLLLLLAAACHR